MTTVLDIDTSDEARQAELLGNLLCDIYQPKKVVDVGCNTGLYLAPFLARGIEVMGYDNNRDNTPQVPITYLDITQPFSDKANLTICLEVLEHIPNELCGQVLDNLLGIGRKLVFSAAQPGQGGVCHINCQTKEYWRKEIEKRGFDFCPGETAFLVKRMTQPGVMGWLLNNLMVFRKRMEYPFSSVCKGFNMDDITVTVTSCGRFHLLKRTMESFWNTNGHLFDVIISDDSEDTYQHDLIVDYFGDKCTVLINGKNRGQAANLDSLYSQVKTPYIFHMEDDWEFINDEAVETSLLIMCGDPTIGLVQMDLRPAYFKVNAIGKDEGDCYSYLPWKLSEQHAPWNGWCGSPHLMQKAVWDKIGPFCSVPKESEYDILYGKSGFRTVWTKKPFVRHIGYGQSTMRSDYRWTK